MRLFKFLSFLGLFFWARASSLKTREPASHPLDARQLTDRCAYVSSELDVRVVPGAEVIIIPIGDIAACLCISTLPLFVLTNGVAGMAASQAVGGESDVINILTGLIIDAAPDSGCNYPDHSNPACVDQDPCGFQCTDGFTAFPPGNPKTCVCEEPSVVCNGQCVEAGPCPTSAPSTSNKKRWLGGGTCAEMGPEWAACGVFGGAARSWECVNTARDLESCGGCMLPLTPYVPVGQDCTSLPGVADVACIAGECVVHRCLPGYVVAHDGNHCVSRHGNISQHSEHDEDEAESVPARVYRLEHVPLRKRKH